jgi:phosphoribosyl 1,2-cyclic phosphodiesterase
MTLRFSVLASGSSGNACLIESDGFGVLVDAGLGPRQLTDRLAEVTAGWHRIHAVLLTHVHGDHWNERTLIHLQRRRIPLYCHDEHQRWLTAASAAFAALHASKLVRTYQADEEIEFTAALRCRPIRVQHDGGATCGFRFEGGFGIFGPLWSVGYVTDLGTWAADLARALGNVDILAVEFNHDVALQLNSGRPPRLIRRVLGDSGHLSNEQAAALVREIDRLSERGRLRHLVQLHLSRDCNRPALARAAAVAVLPNARVHSARVYRAGPCLLLGAAPFRKRCRMLRRVQATWSPYQLCFPGWD